MEADVGRESNVYIVGKGWWPHSLVPLATRGIMNNIIFEQFINNINFFGVRTEPLSVQIIFVIEEEINFIVKILTNSILCI